MVLYATAVENLLKAIRVAKGEVPIVKGSLSPHFMHHKLLAHAQRAQLSLSPDEIDLAEHLRDFLEAGSYPVAKSARKSPRAWRFQFPRDVERVWALLDRLENDLRAVAHDALPAMDVRRRYRPPGYALPA
jgi:hypothetical protein